MYSSLLLLLFSLLYSLCFAVDEANIFFVVAKVAPALFIRIIWSHVTHTHTHTLLNDESALSALALA